MFSNSIIRILFVQSSKLRSSKKIEDILINNECVQKCHKIDKTILFISIVL